ncbi:MAG: GNAT family N-acetyltransferase [Pseudomonadota bacterium]
MLPDYAQALRTGWSPNNTRPEAAQEQLAAIAHDPDAFLRSLEDPEAAGPPVVLPDGSTVPRLPSIRRWIVAQGFAGSIGLRWHPGTNTLPPTCLGHVGYAVVPWRRREGLATQALTDILPLARHVGLTWVDITVDPANAPSIRVIEKAGGRPDGAFERPASQGGGRDLRFRIPL